MTLLQLLKQIRHIEEHLAATEGIPLKKGIPLKMYGYDIDIILGVQQDDNGGHCVNVELIPDAKQFQQMLSERDYEVKITRDIHLDSQTQSSIGDIKI